MLIALVLYVNQVPDRRGDAAVGKRTLIVRWRPDRVVRGYAVAVTVAFVVVAVGAISGILPIWTLVALATVPMARRVWRGLRDHYDKPYELMPAMQTNIGLHLFTGLLLLAGYLIELAVR